MASFIKTILFTPPLKLPFTVSSCPPPFLPLSSSPSPPIHLLPVESPPFFLLRRFKFNFCSHTSDSLVYSLFQFSTTENLFCQKDSTYSLSPFISLEKRIFITFTVSSHSSPHNKKLARPRWENIMNKKKPLIGVPIMAQRVMN